MIGFKETESEQLFFRRVRGYDILICHG